MTRWWWWFANVRRELLKRGGFGRRKCSDRCLQRAAQRRAARSAQRQDRWRICCLLLAHLGRGHLHRVNGHHQLPLLLLRVGADGGRDPLQGRCRCWLCCRRNTSSAGVRGRGGVLLHVDRNRWTQTGWYGSKRLNGSGTGVAGACDKQLKLCAAPARNKRQRAAVPRCRSRRSGRFEAARNKAVSTRIPLLPPSSTSMR